MMMDMRYNNTIRTKFIILYGYIYRLFKVNILSSVKQMGFLMTNFAISVVVIGMIFRCGYVLWKILKILNKWVPTILTKYQLKYYMRKKIIHLTDMCMNGKNGRKDHNAHSKELGLRKSSSMKNTQIIIRYQIK